MTVPQRVLGEDNFVHLTNHGLIALCGVTILPEVPVLERRLGCQPCRMAADRMAETRLMELLTRNPR